MFFEIWKKRKIRILEHCWTWTCPLAVIVFQQLQGSLHKLTTGYIYVRVCWTVGKALANGRPAVARCDKAITDHPNRRNNCSFPPVARMTRLQDWKINYLWKGQIRQSCKKHPACHVSTVYVTQHWNALLGKHYSLQCIYKATALQFAMGPVARCTGADCRVIN